jgi:hypothetical protein
MPRKLTDVQAFLRDLVLILGTPLVLLIGLLAWWRPWAERPIQDVPREPLDPQAVDVGLRDTLWHGLSFHLPPPYVFSTALNYLEVIEVQPLDHGHDAWPGRMALLDLTARAQHHFQETSGNCNLSPDRCWVDTVPPHAVQCQRSGGVPDPELSWTPHLECQLPARSVRVLINAPQGRTREFQDLFYQALAAP